MIAETWRPRPVITGLGVVAPNGVGAEQWWEATRTGQCGIKHIQHFDPSPYPVTLAGEVDNFDPADYLDERLKLQTDRSAWLALAAAEMAFSDAGLVPATCDSTKMGAVIAASLSVNEFAQREIQALWAKGPTFVSAYQSVAGFPGSVAGQISIRYGLKGPVSVPALESAGGLAALYLAGRALANGLQVVISGGAEAPLSPYALACRLNTGELSRSDDPSVAYRPLCEGAGGHVPGEGAAMLIVEDLTFARSRGVPRIYGEIAGYGASHDAYHYARSCPDGKQLARAMSLALERAQAKPSDVDVVFADAAGTPEKDGAEILAIKRVFGDGPAVPVTAPKSISGRLYAAGSSLDVVAAMLSLRDQVIPPTVGRDNEAGRPDINLVRDATSARINTVMVIARGFGGFNSSLVLSKFAE